MATKDEIEKFIRERLMISIDVGAPHDNYGGGRTHKLEVKLLIRDEENPEEFWSADVIAEDEVELDAIR